MKRNKRILLLEMIIAIERETGEDEEAERWGWW